MVRVLVWVTVVLWAAGAMAQSNEQIRFDVRLGNLKAGELAIAGNSSGGRYAVKGRLESTGLVARIRKVRYDASSRGRVSGGRFVPSQYSEATDTGKRKNSAEMAYHGGVPQVKKYDPPRDPRPTDVSAKTQGGTLDPLSELYAVLRTVPEAEACSARIRTFDGRRAAKVEMSRASVNAEQIICNGAYTRVAGFSAEDMAERRNFPFTMVYAPDGNGTWRVTRMELQTLYGKAQLVRR